jgi:hypothetical protein
MNGPGPFYWVFLCVLRVFVARLFCGIRGEMFLAGLASGLGRVGRRR